MEDFPAGPPVATGAAGESAGGGSAGGEGGGDEPAGAAAAAGPAGGRVADAAATAPDRAAASVGGRTAASLDGAEPDGHGAVSPAVYWRRRAVALAVGIGLLTILVWAVNGTLSSSATSPSGDHGAAGSSHRHGRSGSGGDGSGHGGSGHGGTSGGGTSGGGTSGGGAAGGSGSGGRQGGASGGASSSPAGQASTGSAAPGGAAGGAGHSTAPASPSPGASGFPSAAPGVTPSGGTQPSSSATPPADQVPACGPGDVALSLFTPKYWYKRGQLPQFVIAAASASGRPCRFNMGARYVAVVVNYGSERTWSSADCVRGAGSRGVVLTKEHPAISWVTWNRKTSVPGCHPAGHPVKGVTFTVTAVSGQLRSQGMVIVLGAPGVSVP
jgi:hypothetical protein